MPSRPKRVCPRCSRLYDRECECGYGKHGWQADRQRGTRQERGYDQAWQRLRAIKLARDRLCEDCLAQGRVEPATQVHHVRPFVGRDDPGRLDIGNLRSLCEACHGKYATGRR